ncbi:MAG: RidA family protein [Gemmatimonadetes bacterium]|nr:RidA family protein [Gemmatimonadota bacterium]
MEELREVATDSAPAAIGPYSQAMVYGGLVFSAGQIPLDPATGQLVGGDVVAQTEQVLRNLDAVLSEAGASRETVLKTTVFLRDLADFVAVNEVYARFFGTHRPARSTVQVARLPRDSAVEIELVAAIRTDR